MNGKNLIIKVAGAVIAGATSCEWSEQCDIIEVASAQSGKSKEHRAGRSSWSVTTGHLLKHIGNLLPNVTKLEGLPVVGESYDIQFSDGTHTRSGRAICQKVVVVGNVGNIAKGTFSFIGNGSLTNE